VTLQVRRVQLSVVLLAASVVVACSDDMSCTAAGATDVVRIDLRAVAFGTMRPEEFAPNGRECGPVVSLAAARVDPRTKTLTAQSFRDV
jgi:hypothetical protein